jgi:prepilin-type N-terminal cleavage/methylation domain-containing protein
MKRSAKSGFTLVEMLIVVVIMGILAAIVVPQFSQSSDDARYASTVQNLQSLRGQIDLYRNQHANTFPGNTSATADDTTFRDQLTLPTNEAGVTGAFGSPLFPFGPYIHTQLPANPFSGSRVVENVDTFPATAPGGSSPGWVYERTSGRIRINKDGNVPDGSTTYWNL